MAPRKVRSCYRVRRGAARRLGWASVASFVVPWLPAVVGGLLGIPWLEEAGMAAGGLGFLLAAVLALASPIVRFVQARAPAMIDVEHGDLVYLQGATRQVIARDQIEGGVLIPSSPSPMLEVYLRDGDLVRIAVEDERAGEALLDELGVGAAKRRVRIELADDARKLLVMIPRMAATVFVWFLILGMIIDPYQAATGQPLPSLFLGPWLACIVGTLLLWQRLARPARLEIGSDGVSVERALRERFIPHASTAKVWAHGKQVFFRDHAGALTSVGGSLAQKGAESNAHAAPTALAAVRRIEEARRAAPGESVAAQLAQKLDRAGRSVAAWRNDLANVLSSDTGYRSVKLGAEDVATVLADASAPADRRIGAALALKAAGVPDAPKKIRVAAGLTSNDELRRALEQVAEDEAEAEVEAIDEALRIRSRS